MKITNYQALILLELEHTELDKGIWQQDLFEQLNTPSTTLRDNLKKLREEKKLVENYEKNNGMRGRNKVYFYITNLGRRAIQIIQEGMK